MRDTSYYAVITYPGYFILSSYKARGILYIKQLEHACETLYYVVITCVGYFILRSYNVRRLFYFKQL